MRRRLRKKRRVGEFQELGIELSLTLRSGIDFDAFLDDFLTSAIEVHGLRFGGSGSSTHLSGVVELGRRDVASTHRDVLEGWLAADRRIDAYTVSQFVDLWHCD